MYIWLPLCKAKKNWPQKKTVNEDVMMTISLYKILVQKDKSSRPHLSPMTSTEFENTLFQVTCRAGLLMVSSSSLARVATAGLTSSTEARKQQKAWAREYFSEWFFVTAPMSRNRQSTATFSTGSFHDNTEWKGTSSATDADYTKRRGNWAATCLAIIT